jgi:hypothetical protein
MDPATLAKRAALPAFACRLAQRRREVPAVPAAAVALAVAVTDMLGRAGVMPKALTHPSMVRRVIFGKAVPPSDWAVLTSPHKMGVATLFGKDALPQETVLK